MKKYIRKTELFHYGVDGMRWGYTNGQRNGGRTAKDEEKDGFEFGKTRRMEAQYETGVAVPGGGDYSLDNEVYKINSPATDGQWVNVSKEEYDSSAGYHLYYNNERVSDIIQRNVSKTIKEVTAAASDLIDKGKKFLDNLFK